MTLNPKNNSLKISLHILAWVILLFIPFMMFPREPNNYWRDMPRSILSLSEYAIIFYVNYFILTTRFLFHKKFLLFVGCNALMILIFLWFNWQFRHLFFPTDMPKMKNMGRVVTGSKMFAFGKGIPRGPSINFFALQDFFSFIIPIIFSIAIRATERWIKSEAEKKEIENRNLQSELTHLRYQLQPHFFFNSLNNIYSLIEVSPSKAQEAVHSLSKLMRYLLYDTGHEKVELSQEISFLKGYVQLMEMRHTDKTKTEVIFPEQTASKYTIAPLLFIPLIENAYKHGVSATKLSLIRFKMHVENNTVYFLSENNNFPKNDSDKSGSGIGLENLKKRLELLYPQQHALTTEVEHGIFHVELKINLKN